MTTETEQAADIIRQAIGQTEADQEQRSMLGNASGVLPSFSFYEGKLAGLHFALGALAAPDPFAGLTGADAVGADPGHDFVANGGHR